MKRFVLDHGDWLLVFVEESIEKIDLRLESLLEGLILVLLLFKNWGTKSDTDRVEG